MPSGVNGTPTIEPLNIDGPNLNDPAPLSYFFDKFILESKVPPSRFHNPDGGSTSPYSNGAEGLDKEEIRFSKFISGLRSVFQEILIKPLWISMIKKYPKLEDDFLFKSQLGLDYFSDNPFKLNQEIDIMNKRKESITSVSGLMGDEEKPYFSTAYLVEKFLGLTKQDIDANKESIKRREKEKEKAEKKGKKEDGAEEVTL